jgi:hypothetical protein
MGDLRFQAHMLYRRLAEPGEPRHVFVERWVNAQLEARRLEESTRCRSGDPSEVAESLETFRRQNQRFRHERELTELKRRSERLPYMPARRAPARMPDRNSPHLVLVARPRERRSSRRLARSAGGGKDGPQPPGEDPPASDLQRAHALVLLLDRDELLVLADIAEKRADILLAAEWAAS